MQRIKNFLAYLNSFSRRSKIIAGVAALVVVVVLLHLGKGAPAASVADTTTHVRLASVASLSNSGGPLPVTGRVTSVSQASLSALSGGQITSLPHKLGDRVAAGSIIASFENSSQRAAVLQAQGSYDAALAGQRAVSPVDTSAAAINTSRAAYTTLDIVLRTQVDTFFGEQTSVGPLLLIDAPTFNQGEFSRGRRAISLEMDEFAATLAQAPADPSAFLSSATKTTQDVAAFVAKLAVAANQRNSRATQEQLQALAAARTSLNTLTTALAAAQQAYRSGSVTTTASTDASVTIALGGLRAAQANLEKTYVRAPISGTIVSLPVNRGDFVAPGAVVAIISNPGALQVESYVTAADAATLAVGGKATIEGTSPGTVVFIAPALDPTTGKIQVKVSPTQSLSSLADGSTVTVTLDRASTAGGKAKNTISIPIAAAKITPTGPVVFTVASSTLVAHPITFGNIVGGQVEVPQGLTLDMDIVTDARGLFDGQVVTVDSQ